MIEKEILLRAQADKALTQTQMFTFYVEPFYARFFGLKRQMQVVLI